MEMPMNCKMVLPKHQKANNTKKAVKLLRRVSRLTSCLDKPLVNGAKIGNKPTGSMATKINTKFSKNKLVTMVLDVERGGI
jgi:hypothetical protein